MLKQTVLGLMTNTKRLVLDMKIRTMEIQLDGINECLERVCDKDTRERMMVARRLLRKELARIRSEYNATLPVGIRRTWGLA